MTRHSDTSLRIAFDSIRRGETRTEFVERLAKFAANMRRNKPYRDKIKKGQG